MSTDESFHSQQPQPPQPPQPPPPTLQSRASMKRLSTNPSSHSNWSEILVNEQYPVIREGYLQKKPGGDRSEQKKFKTRWCIIKANKLFYFKFLQDVQPKGVIDLAEECSVRFHGKDVDGTDVYALDTPRKTYLLFSDRSNDDMKDWVADIKNAIAQKKSFVKQVDGMLSLTIVDVQDLVKEADVHVLVSLRRQVWKTSSAKKVQKLAVYDESCTLDVKELPSSIMIVVLSKEKEFLGCANIRVRWEMVAECAQKPLEMTLHLCQRKMRERVSGVIRVRLYLQAVDRPLSDGQTMPLFGTSVEQLMARPDHESFPVPFIFLVCIPVLVAQNYETQAGIFRISPSIQELRQLKAALEESIHSLSHFSTSEADPHLYASLLKLFLRELDPPLLPYSLYDRFLACNREAKRVEDTVIQLLRKVFDELDPMVQRCWSLVLYTLKRVHDLADVNLMPATNLAAIFAPVLCRPVVETLETLMTDMPSCQYVLDVAIRRARELFPNGDRLWAEALRGLSRSQPASYKMIYDEAGEYSNPLLADIDVS
eukprot:ANDGO_06577.mRNA.1 Rho GTPase-activating protein gacEE